MGKIKVARHLPDDRELLIVLLSKKSRIGTSLVEQFRHHGGDPVKMAGPGCTAQAVADPADAHAGGIAGRIHLVRRRGPQQFHPGCFQQRGVGSFLARIGIQILTLAKLGGIDKDRCHHRVAMLSRHFDQTHMACVQRSHRGNQPDFQTRLAKFRQGVPQRVELSNNLHASLFAFRFCPVARLSYGGRPSQGPRTGISLKT